LQSGATGAAYVFRFALDLGAPCAAPTECVSGLCVDGVCCDTVCGGGAPDDCLACAHASASPENGRCGPAAFGALCHPATDCSAQASCDGVATACPATIASLDGTSCDGGQCVAGACSATPFTDSAPSPFDAGPAPADAGAPPEDAVDGSGGGCSASDADARLPALGAAVVVALALLGAVRRRRAR
jgi:MYXO-CTERM domain-containing protein